MVPSKRYRQEHQKLVPRRPAIARARNDRTYPRVKGLFEGSRSTSALPNTTWASYLTVCAPWLTMALRPTVERGLVSFYQSILTVVYSNALFNSREENPSMRMQMGQEHVYGSFWCASLFVQTPTVPRRCTAHQGRGQGFCARSFRPDQKGTATPTSCTPGIAATGR